MSYAGLADRRVIETEMPFDERAVPLSMWANLDSMSKTFGARPAVSFQLTSGPKDPAQTLTWTDLRDQTAQTANYFRSLGIGPTDVVAFVLPNCLETLVTLTGAMVAGIANPINPLLEAEHIAAILRETHAKIVVTLKSFPKTDIAQKVAEAVRHAPGVHTVLEIDLNTYLSPPKSWLVPFLRPKIAGDRRADVRDFATAIKAQPTELIFDDPQVDRIAAFFHTGGTTGMPKVAQHLYSGMAYNGYLGASLLFTEHDNIMCPLPMFHVFAVHVIFMAAAQSGSHVIFPTPAGYRGEGVFDNFWKLCERWKITFLITVPTAVSALMQRPVDADISTIKTAFSGSAPMPLELFKRFEAACGVRICEGYGLTEATCLVAINPPDGEKKVGSVGIPFPYTDVKILHTLGCGGPQECGVDEIGEICVANPGVYAGSTYTETDKNHELFHYDVYLRTGDLGRIDEDGYLWITGRAKDLIIRGGHNIDPGEIEEALLLHPAVAFAGAIGQPDSHAGELPCAYVELVGGAEVKIEELMAHCRVNVHERAAYPKHIEILEELPKTAVGKVFKPDLRKLAITRVFNRKFEQSDLQARVEAVFDDKKRGLTAKISANGDQVTDIANALGCFTTPWDPL